MSRRSYDRLAARATDLARIAVAEERNTPKLRLRAVPADDSSPAVTAMYLAVCNAYVTVTRHASGLYRVACEACGPLSAEGHTGDAVPNEKAQRHAETCRRLPERLWPKGGAQ